MINKNKRIWLRSLALLMVLVMTATLLPLEALAAGEPEDADEVEIAPTPYMNVIDPGDAAAEETSDEAEPDPEEPAPETPAPETEEPAADPEAAPADPEEPAPGSDEPGGEPPADGTEEPSDGSDEPAVYTVSYYNGETLVSTEEVEAGALPKAIPATVGGRLVSGWRTKEGALAGKAPIEEDTVYHAVLMPQLETEKHQRYIRGVGDGLFKPLDSLTRAQAATILCGLLNYTEPGPYATTFSDVKSGAWYYQYVTDLASYGVLSGYDDGTFKPNKPVTRAEFVSILVRITGVTGAGSSFTDIDHHWARKDIEAAAAQGWISGYEENGILTFRPNREIRRCEAVVIVNQVTGRKADQAALAASGSATVYLDVSPSKWYYSAVMEASVPHGYTRTETGEVWSDYSIEGAGLAPGKYSADSGWFLIGSNGQPVSLNAGINKVDGAYYYAAAAGTYFTGDLSAKSGSCVFFNGSEQALANGFNMIGSTLFYYEKSKAAPKLLSAGLNTLEGTTYWSDGGYNIRNDFGEGVVELGGKHYLSGGHCDIITTGLTYVYATSKPVNTDLRGRTFEHAVPVGTNSDGTVKRESRMFYVKNDYSLACDEWIQYLYFGKNCAYTTGNATIDAYVWNVVKDFINNSALTKEQKLLKAYYYIRGGEGQKYAASPFKYRKRDIAYERGRYNGQFQYSWIIDSALRMFTQKAGMCYEWAAIYLYMARRLGFQSYVVVGSIFASSTRHCWCMIQWDGYWHISDVEIEWGYLAGWYSDQAVYRNLFAQTVSREDYNSYKNPECTLTYWIWEESN